MKSLKNLLNKKFSPAKKIAPGKLDEKTVFFVFQKIIKEEFGNVGAANFQPDYFDGQKIFLKCQSSNWASELWLNRQKIIRGINKELGEEMISEIKIK